MKLRIIKTLDDQYAVQEAYDGGEYWHTEGTFLTKEMAVNKLNKLIEERRKVEEYNKLVESGKHIVMEVDV